MKRYEKVDLLVPVMEKLAAWTRPVIMIPGNHDQVTFGGGMHALTPLQFAFTDPAQVRALPARTGKIVGICRRSTFTGKSYRAEEGHLISKIMLKFATAV